MESASGDVSVVVRLFEPMPVKLVISDCLSLDLVALPFLPALLFFTLFLTTLVKRTSASASASSSADEELSTPETKLTI